MFRSLKLKNTTLCELSLLFTPVLSAIAGIIAFFLVPDEDLAIFIPLGFFAIAVILLVRNTYRVFSIDFTLSSLSNWQKDRLYFFTDINGKTRAEAEAAISQRVQNWNTVKKNADNTALLEKCKTVNSFSALFSRIHHSVIIYSVPTLTLAEYKQKLESAYEKANALAKDEKVVISTAVIFLADNVEQAVLDIVRDIPEDEKFNVSVLPCVFNCSTGFYHINALKDYNFFAKSPNNYTIKDIEKIVFGGKFPLENNDNFDYSNEICKWQDKTMGDLLDDLKQEEKKDKQFIKDTAEQLIDGQVLFHEETLYLKHNNRLASYMAFTDEVDPNKMTVFNDDTWAYPKNTTISKKDRVTLKEMAKKHFEALNFEVEFIDEDTDDE